jgi:hypothetical protein
MKQGSTVSAIERAKVDEVSEQKLAKAAKQEEGNSLAA